LPSGLVTLPIVSDAVVASSFWIVPDARLRAIPRSSGCRGDVEVSLASTAVSPAINTPRSSTAGREKLSVPDVAV
jgi:hypothetical protein